MSASLEKKIWAAKSGPEKCLVRTEESTVNHRDSVYRPEEWTVPSTDLTIRLGWAEFR